MTLSPVRSIAFSSSHADEKNGSFPLASEPDDIAATFREQLLPLTSVRSSMMFHEVWIYFTENGSVGTDIDGKGAERQGLRCTCGKHGTGRGTGDPGCICHILNDCKIRLDHMSQ
jgi:hypothetical protein